MYATAAGNSAADALSSKSASASSESSSSASAAAAAQSATDAQTAATSAESSASTATAQAASAVSSANDAYASALTAQTAVTGLLRYAGSFDASTGAFPANPTEGDFWKVGTAGVVGGVDLKVGDQIIYSGTGWDHIDNTESVTSVAGRVGNVTLGITDIASLQGALDAKASAANAYLSGTVEFQSNGGSASFGPGTGDGASYSTYNVMWKLWWGLGMQSYDGVIRGFYDSRAGRWDTLSAPRVNGVDVWYPGNFNPGSYAALSGATFSGRGTFSNPGTTGTMATSAGGLGCLWAYNGTQPGGAAFMAFHRSNIFACYFGLDTDNKLKVGGWSMGNAAYELWHAGNAPISQSPSNGTLVQRTANGYINCNYINTTANDIGGGAPSHIAVQQGDNYLRWQTPASFRAAMKTPAIYVQATDPGAVPDGSLWFW